MPVRVGVLVTFGVLVAVGVIVAVGVLVPVGVQVGSVLVESEASSVFPNAPRFTCCPWGKGSLAKLEVGAPASISGLWFGSASQEPP